MPWNLVTDVPLDLPEMTGVVSWKDALLGKRKRRERLQVPWSWDPVPEAGEERIISQINRQPFTDAAEN